MEWVEIKIEDVLAHMPTDVKARYQTWLTANPDRADRLRQIMDNTLREFRDNLKSVPENIVDPRETWVPQSAVRHLETIIVFSIGMEMGLPIDSAALGARYSADIFLRQILMGRYKATTESAGTPSPRYSIPERDTISGRALPILLALFVFVQQALGGWIRPDSGPLDTDIITTFTPSSYSITTASLFGHLQGINAALIPLATTNYVNAAVAAMSLSNTVDATARALASSASIAANAALNSLSAYLPLSGGTQTLDANGQTFTNINIIGAATVSSPILTNVTAIAAPYTPNPSGLTPSPGHDILIRASDASGNLMVGGKLILSGGKALNTGFPLNNVEILSPLVSRQSAFIQSNLVVMGETRVSNSVAVATNLTVGSFLSAGGNAVIGGGLTVSNSATIKDSIVVSSNLTVGKYAALNGGASITIPEPSTPSAWPGYIVHSNWSTVFMAPRYEYYAQGAFKFMGPAEWGWNEDQTNLYISGAGIRIYPTLYARSVSLADTLDLNGNAISNAGTIVVSNLVLAGVSRSNWPAASSGPVSNVVAQGTASSWDPATGTLGINTNDACRVSAGTLAPFHGTFNPASTAGTPYYFDTHGELAPQSGNNSSLRGFVVPQNYRITGASLTRRVGGTYGVSNAAPVAIMLYNKTLDQYANLFPDVGYGSDFPPPMATNGLDIMLWASNEYSVAMSRVAWTTAPTSVRNVVILYIDKE